MKLKVKLRKMNIKIIVASLLLISSFESPAQKKASGNKGEIIYHVFQRSFYDGNGDKQGDLNGLKEKLPYLQDLVSLQFCCCHYMRLIVITTISLMILKRSMLSLVRCKIIFHL